jgi:hypothetical protein
MSASTHIELVTVFTTIALFALATARSAPSLRRLDGYQDRADRRLRRTR